MSNPRVDQLKRRACTALVCALLVVSASLASIYRMQHASERLQQQMREARVELQRSSEALLWLQKTRAQQPALSLEADELATMLIDALSLLSAEDGVLDWKFEQTNADTYRVRASSTLLDVRTLTLVVDVNVKHGPHLLTVLDQLRSIALHRPVQVRSCRIERVPSASRLSSTSFNWPLAGRCELDWPWWAEV